MFFWMMLASLMGVIMFGNLREQTKSEEDFVAPVYHAMALSMYQQHVAVQYAVLDILRKEPDNANGYFNSASFTDGIVPLATVEKRGDEGIKMDGVDGNNAVFPYIENRLPHTYKPQNGTRSYLFCVDKNQSAEVSCSNSNAVKYVVTLRPIPVRYDGADKMVALRAVAESTGYSRFVGMLQKASAPFSSAGDSTEHQPLGASYYILSSGVAPVNSVYIPDFITCNFPLNDNDGNTTLGDTAESKSYLVALTLVSGLAPGENLQSGMPPLGCSAVPQPEPEE